MSSGYFAQLTLRAASVLFLFLRGAGLSAQDTLTDAQAEHLLRSAHAIIEDQGFGRLPYDFAWNLQSMGRRYGLPDLEYPQDESPSTSPIPDPTDSLLSLMPPPEALRAAERIDRSRTTGAWVRYLVFEALLRRGMSIAETLDLAVETGMLDVALGAIEQERGARSSFEPEMLAWESTRSLTRHQKNLVRRSLLVDLVTRDRDGSFTRIMADTAPEVRAPALRWWLNVYGGKLPADSLSALVVLGIRTAQRTPATPAKDSLLTDYHEICAFRSVAACAPFRLPASTSSFRFHETSFLNDLNGSDVRAADSVLALVTQEGLAEPSLLALIARGIVEGCERGTGCEAERRPMRERWMERLEAFGATGAPAADTVRAALAQMWAIDDAARAARWLGQVRDARLARYAGWQAAQSAYVTDFWGAVDLVRRSARPGSSIVGFPGDMYTRLMSLGRPDVEEELLGLLPSAEARMNERFAWAETLARAGRVDEARTMSFRILEGWNPDGEVESGLWYGLRVFREVHAEQALLAWVDSLPDTPAKARVMLSIASWDRHLWLGSLPKPDPAR